MGYLISKSIAKGSRPLVLDSKLASVELEYTKTRNEYIVHGTDQIEVKDLLKIVPRDYVLFPNGVLASEGFRRVDGQWVVFEDPLANEILYRSCSVIEHGGYPLTVESALVSFGKENVKQVSTALLQLVSTACVGEYSPHFFGYDPTDTSEVVDETDPNVNVYCGSLALWEADENDIYPHTLISLAHVLAKVGNSERPVVALIEEECSKRGVKGYPSRGRFLLAFEFALNVAKGKVTLVDAPPTPYTRI